MIKDQETNKLLSNRDNIYNLFIIFIFLQQCIQFLSVNQHYDEAIHTWL